jgi:5,10-methylenetetrahydromethanopterin reductase
VAHPLELWCAVNGFPGTTEKNAAQAEADGWDGLGVPDSQNMTGDPFVALALGAKATDKLLLAPWVSNPVTRHPAVAAASIHTVQVESNGRAIFGIGRGDSSVTHLGFAPAPVKVFKHYIERMQGYLKGEVVPFELDTDFKGELSSADTLNMADTPKGSQLRWMRHAKAPKVPIDGAASGPKVIATCAQVCDRVTFAVGADPERVKWAIDIARNARSEAGLDPDDLVLGVMFQVSPHPDRALAVESIKGTIASTARFSVMHGKIVGPVSDKVREGLLAIHAAYDFHKHSRRGGHTDVITDEIIDAFTVVGPPDRCVERLAELRELGITRFHILAAEWREIDPKLQEHSRKSLSEEVLPGLREATAKIEAREQQPVPAGAAADGDGR